MVIMAGSRARVTDPVLTTIVQGYAQPQFIGQRFMPPVPVGTRSGRVIEFGKEDFALYDTRRAPGGRIKRTTSQYSNRSYNLYQDSIAEEVPIELFEEALNGAARINLRNSGPKKAQRKVMLRLEKDSADLIQKPSLYENNCTIALLGTDRWDDYANSDPCSDVRAWKQEVRAQTGVFPNRIGLGSRVFDTLAEHPVVRDKFKYVSAESVTTQMLAQMFEVESVDKGESTVLDRSSGELVDIWGDNFWMCYVPNGLDGQLPVPQEGAMKEEPSFGYTYTLQGYPVSLPERFDEDTASYIYTVMAERSPELVGMGNTGKVGAGFLATNVIS